MTTLLSIAGCALLFALVVAVPLRRGHGGTGCGGECGACGSGDHCERGEEPRARSWTPERGEKGPPARGRPTTKGPWR